MANQKRLKREEMGVKAGDEIVIKGTVSFARLDKLVEGEALDRENERRKGFGMLTTKPFRSVTIDNLEIVKGQGTPLAQFYGQEVYTSKGSGLATLNVESKSLFAPQFGHIQNGTIVEIADPMKNPSTGQVVYLMIKAYAVKGYSNLGSTFNSIVYGEGPINFYEGASSLAGFGQALGMPVQGLTPVAAAEHLEHAEPVAPVAPVQTNAFGQQAPVEQPLQGQPIADPFAGNAAASNPFGVQDNAAAQAQTGGNPFGGGAGANSPFA